MNFVKEFPEELSARMRPYAGGTPSPMLTADFTDRLYRLLFPLSPEVICDDGPIQSEWQRLQRDFVDLLLPLASRLKEIPEEPAGSFFEAVPAIHAQLVEEAAHFVRCDPAADGVEEVILCYPGFYALAVYRLANELYRMQVPILPRAMSEHAHSRTGIDIHPGASIGRYFYIDHGTGIVIGETAVIGNYVKIYQGVTLGALYVDKSLRNSKRHPTIEDNVIIYAGATILGGDTVIGHDTVVGGNVWLTESVAPDSVVYHKAEMGIKNRKKRKE